MAIYLPVFLFRLTVCVHYFPLLYPYANKIKCAILLVKNKGTGVMTNSATATNCVSLYDLRGIH